MENEPFEPGERPLNQPTIIVMSQTVLVVDDSADVRLVCRVNLEYHGFVVREAEDGARALEMIREQTPDLVLLDVMMPDMDGWEILSTLKSEPETASIPVVMLTARTREADQIRGWRAGASDYIIKPFNPEALIPTVRAALDRGDAEKHRREKLDMLRFTQKVIGETGTDREQTPV
jgi:DNA-binding response OmpR family regulator